MALVHFRDVLGQEKANRLLRLAFSRQRTTHGHLFHGPVGVGKKMLAQAFAGLLLCRAEGREDSCGQCSSCRKMASGNHPDFLVVRPDGGVQIKIDQIRALKKSLAYAPVEGGYRVVLLADIHQTMARAEVANSLLKTLEEPPAQTVFVLTVVEAAGILPTIVSRCQGIPFFPLPDDLVRARLLAEGLPEDRAWAVALLAAGSLGRARDFAHAELLETWQRLVLALVDLRQARPGAVETVFSLAELAAGLKDDLATLLELLLLWLKRAMLRGTGGADALAGDLALEEAESQAGRRWTVPQIFARMDLIRQAQRQLRHNCTRAFVLEVLLWRIIEE